MPLINKIIGQQNFEIIRDRIASILVDEIANQKSYTGDQDLSMTIGIEQRIPFDKEELPMLNISIDEGNFSGRNVGEARGTFVFFVDYINDLKHTDAIKGDVRTAVIVEKIIGLCYAILSNVIYRTLGFDPSTSGIERIEANTVKVGDINTADARHTMLGRLAVSVTFNQGTSLQDARLLEGYETQVKMGESDSGFKFTTDI